MPVVLVVAALAVLVLGPVLWSRGYVLVADMTFVPDQPWKPAWLGLDGSVPRAVPADAVVSVLGLVLPGDLLQKAILLGVLLAAGFGMLRLARHLPAVPATAALGGAVLYLWNPYVFERLAIGQWGLLVGYAALPWVLSASLDLRADRGRGAGVLLAALLVAAVGSPTGGLIAGVVAIVVTAGRDRVRRTLAVAATVVLVNVPWLAPALLNQAGPSDDAGVTAFAARADTPLGAWGSLLSFGGLWKSAAAPGERDVALLAIAALVVSLLSLAAFARVARHRPSLAKGRLIGLALAGLLLAGLPATEPGADLARAVVGAVPGAGLWRDSQKWLMPFVLVTCLGFVLVLDGVVRFLRRHHLPAVSSSFVLALLPVVLLPSLAWGLSGRFVPVRYPDEWGTVRAILEHQPAVSRRTAVLPWSAYQRLPWNGRRAALDPAQRYFPGQVVVSQDLTVGSHLIVPGDDHDQAAIGRAIAQREPLGPVLAGHGVRYLLVEKTAPSAVDVQVPPGNVLHDGSQLLLVDLGVPGREVKAPHGRLIVAADVSGGVLLLALTTLLIRRRRGARIRYDARGSMINGDDLADET